MSRSQAEVGSTANSYEILAKLATGGMAEIFLARGASVAGVERYVVLKRVLRERATDASFIRMFLDEARLAAQLQHPSIAQVYDIGKLGDSYFFTMEYVHGETVRALLQRSHALRRPISIGSVLTIAAGAAAGLHHAHERIGVDGRPLGIVHRDVSPSNLMVSYEGNVKVVDFGVAKAAHRSQETRSGTVKGKISYLSPEQCRGREIDRRSDLFSLGIVTWEMLTSERLFRLGSDFETMAAIVGDPTPAPSTRRADVPAELDALVLKLLAKDPADRFQSGDELLEAIEQCAVRIGVALSAASLARFVKELFGQRPEPWIELQTQETHAEPVTVTSEPIPPDFGLAEVAPLEQQLASVRDISAVRPRSPSRSPLPGAEAAAVAPPPEPGDGVETTPVPKVHASAVPTMIGIAPSQSVPSMAGMAIPVGLPLRPSVPPPPERRRGAPLVVWILGPAVVIGVLIGIVLAMRGGHATTVAATRGSGSAVAASLDAAVAQLPADAAAAAVVAPVAPDAAVTAVVPPVDAAVAATATPPPAVTPARHPHDTASKPASKIEDVSALYADGKFAEVVAECAGAPAVAAGNPLVCTLAACRAHDVARARKWLATAPAGKRAGIVSACAQAGVQLAPSPRHEAADDECRRDPFACQH